MKETPDISSSTDDYAKRFSGEIGNWLLEVQEAALYFLLDDEFYTSVLDVGGGHGQIATSLAKKRMKITVTGSNSQCAKRLAPLISENKINFIESNLLALNVPDRSFDLVTSFRILPHLDNWEKFINELCRVSNKAVIIDFPLINSINFFGGYFFQLKKKLEHNTRTYHSFLMKEVIDVFTENGFSVRGVYKQYFLPMVLHRILKNRKLSITLESFFKFLKLTDLFGSPVVIRFERVTG